jgi:hypothetical protein
MIFLDDRQAVKKTTVKAWTTTPAAAGPVVSEDVRI